MKLSLKMFVLVIVCVMAPMLCSFAFENGENVNGNCQRSTISLNNLKFKSLNSDGELYDFDGELKDIYERFTGILPDGVPTEGEELLSANGIIEVLDYILSYLDTSGAARSFLLLIGISLLMCLAETATEDMADNSAVIRACVAVCLTMPILSIMKEALLSVEAGLISGSELFSDIIPILSSIAAIGAGATTASVSAATMSLSLGFVSKLLGENLLMLGMLLFSISLISSFDTGQVICGVSKGLRGLFNFLIGISSLVIVATLGCQSVISVSADTLAVRGARYAISGMIPVVGSTVSGALSTLISGVKLLSGTVGVLSVVALLSVMGGPLIILLFYRISLSACVTLCSFSGGVFFEKFFSSLRSALDTVIAILASSILIYILEIVILTRALGGIS